MVLTLRQIEVFRAVMRAQTVLGAASQLRITQPTVTRTIQRLEDILKTQLFDRSGGRLNPTAEAHRILDEIDRAFTDLEGAIERVAHIGASDVGLFRFGASPSVGRALVPRAIAALLRERSRLSVNVDVLSVAQILDYLTDGPGEGVVSLFPIIQGGVQSSCVGTGRLVALIPHSLRRTLAAPLGADDLEGAPLITFDPQSVHGQMMSRFLAAGGIAPARTHRVRFAETAVGLAEAGVGVALVDEFSAASADRSHVDAVPTNSPDLFRVYLHRNVKRAQSQFMRLLETALRDELEARDVKNDGDLGTRLRGNSHNMS